MICISFSDLAILKVFLYLNLRCLNASCQCNRKSFYFYFPNKYIYQISCSILVFHWQHKIRWYIFHWFLLPLPRSKRMIHVIMKTTPKRINFYVMEVYLYWNLYNWILSFVFYSLIRYMFLATSAFYFSATFVLLLKFRYMYCSGQWKKNKWSESCTSCTSSYFFQVFGKHVYEIDLLVIRVLSKVE